MAVAQSPHTVVVERILKFNYRKFDLYICVFVSTKDWIRFCVPLDRLSSILPSWRAGTADLAPFALIKTSPLVLNFENLSEEGYGLLVKPLCEEFIALRTPPPPPPSVSPSALSAIVPPSAAPTIGAPSLHSRSNMDSVASTELMVHDLMHSEILSLLELASVKNDPLALKTVQVIVNNSNILRSTLEVIPSMRNEIERLKAERLNSKQFSTLLGGTASISTSGGKPNVQIKTEVEPFGLHHFEIRDGRIHCKVAGCDKDYAASRSKTAFFTHLQNSHRIDVSNATLPSKRDRDDASDGESDAEEPQKKKPKKGLKG